MAMKTESASPQISFRVSPSVAEELHNRGQTVGLSPGEFSRKLVVQALAEAIDPELKPLTRRDIAPLLSELRRYLHDQLESTTKGGEPTSVLRQIKLLREDLATTALAF